MSTQPISFASVVRRALSCLAALAAVWLLTSCAGSPDSEATVTTGGDDTPTLADADETTGAETTDKIEPNTLTTIDVAAASPSFSSQSSATEGATDADGGRLLAGADRYATAVLLAEVPLDAGDAGTGDVLVVSGESLVDAVSAVSVAASRDAVVVLTESGRVPAPVREMLAERGFASATIGGGTNAVSDAVSGDLAGLVADDGDRSSGSADDRSGDANAEAGRIKGATRYDTAVAAAEEAGDPGTWCDTGDTTAVLVNGQSLVDGVIAAPVAYAWELPLLFTERDALPDRVAEYLDEANIERVVAVGSTNDIRAAVTDALEGLGVEVTLIDGRTPAARSVQLVEAVEGCQSQPVAPGEYALLDANQPVDGVAAAAALATGLGEHSASDDLIPVLAVGQNSLPKVVADYLAEAGEHYGDITLYPLGGDARLTPQVISRAVAAAEGDDATDDATDGLTDDDAADTRDLTERLVAAGLTVGETDGTGVAVGHNVVVEGGVVRVEPPAGRTVRVVRTQIGSPDADANPIPGEWFVSPGVLDPYLWQPEVEVREAGVDHDGDGELSADERWPLGSPERAEYMVASGGQAPPGATVMVVPDIRARKGGFEGERNTAVRYPVGIPVPPGAPDRSATTFEERQAERKARFEAYSGGRKFGRWEIHYTLLCELTPEGRPGTSIPGVTSTADGVTCETAADWYLWMCDTMNSPEISQLGFVDAWLTTIDRFQDQWISQLPASWLFQEGLEDSRVVGTWREEQNTIPLCTYNVDPSDYNSEANLAFKAAALRELNEWGSDPMNGFTAGSGTPDADSAFWDATPNRMFALRYVSELRRNQSHQHACDRDVRECSVGNYGSTWGLRGLA